MSLYIFITYMFHYHSTRYFYNL